MLTTGDREGAVVGGAGGVDDRVVVLLQVIQREVSTDVDVAEQADLRLIEHAVERLDDALNTRVVRRDTIADQPKWRGHAFENVDAHAIDRGIPLRVGDGRLRERIGGVNASRARANDGDAERAGVVSCSFRHVCFRSNLRFQTNPPI